MKCIQFCAVSVSIFFFVACVSQPKVDITVVSNEAQKKHLDMSFEELAQVGLYLQSASACSLPEDKVSAMMTVYRAFVDEKYSEEQDIYLKKTLKEKIKYWNQQCEATCSCDIYIGFSEYLQSFNFLLSTTEKTVLEKLEAKVKIENGARVACMNQAPWVCGSRILKDIRNKVEK